MNFKKIDINNKYTVKLSFEEKFSYDNLIYLYSPVIGIEASFLYMFLFTESKNMFINSVFVSQERLILVLNKSSEKIEKMINRLELVGLVNVYVNPATKNKITFVLNRPLTQQQFLNSKTMSTILKGKIGEQNIMINSKQANLNKFELDPELISLTKEFTIKTSEVNLQKENLKYTFDFSVLYEILDKKEIDYSNWNEELHEEITSSILIYDLSISDIVKIMLTIKQMNLTINTENFSKFIKNNKQISNNIFNKVIDYEESTKETQMNILENLTPNELIFIQLDRIPNPLEKKLIVQLKDEFNLNDKIINTLLNHSLIINGSLVPNYIIKIATTLLKNNILTIEEVREHLKSAYKIGDKKPYVEKKKEFIESEKIDWD